MPFGPPPGKRAPKSIKMSKKSIFGHFNSPKMDFLDISIDFWGGPKWHFSDSKKCTFGVSGFRGFVEGPGDCNTCFCFRFRDSFGRFLPPFSDASVTFSSLFCRTPFAAGYCFFPCQKIALAYHYGRKKIPTLLIRKHCLHVTNM